MGGPEMAPQTPRAPISALEHTRPGVQPDGEDDGGGEQQTAHQPVDDGQREDGRLLAGDPDRREAREIRADPERQLQAEQAEQRARQRPSTPWATTVRTATRPSIRSVAPRRHNAAARASVSRPTVAPSRRWPCS